MVGAKRGGAEVGCSSSSTSNWFISVNARRPFAGLLSLLVAATDDPTR